MLKRKKGQHLTQTEYKYIVQMMKQNPNDPAVLQKLFRLSKSTLKRLNKEYDENLQKDELRLFERKDNNELSSIAKDFIRKYIIPPTTPVTIKKLQKAIRTAVGEEYSMHIVRKYIRDTLKYRSKKGSSRPPKYVSRRIQLVKSLFCTELLSLIYRREIIINVDEWSFTFN